MKIPLMPYFLLAFAAIAANTTHTACAEDGNLSSITQIGQDNAADLRQKFIAAGAVGVSNSTSILQDGTANTTDILQEGSSLNVTVEQSGSNNTGTVQQYGSGLSASVTQTGNNLTAEIKQLNLYGGSTAPVVVNQR